ncbi:MAG: DUF1836 domain-containing protein [Firmicutes bacterium]|nr:DUF1836 domain-containing protein [Bacillota bacterium]
MEYNNDLVAGKLRRWERYLENYHLPKWEEIPNLGLYMEQVIALLKQYLDYLPPELKEEQFITSATINNYVRMKVMPGPEKKRYYRIHIAYLLIICSLKQGLSLALIQKIIPIDIEEAEVRRIYENYIDTHQKSALYFISHVRLFAGKILNHSDAPDFAVDSTDQLIVESAVIGNLCRLLAEKLMLLEGKNLEDGGSIEIERR